MWRKHGREKHIPSIKMDLNTLPPACIRATANLKILRFNPNLQLIIIYIEYRILNIEYIHISSEYRTLLDIIRTVFYLYIAGSLSWFNARWCSKNWTMCYQSRTVILAQNMTSWHSLMSWLEPRLKCHLRALISQRKANWSKYNVIVT